MLRLWGGISELLPDELLLIKTTTFREMFLHLFTLAHPEIFVNGFRSYNTQNRSLLPVLLLL